MQSIFDFETVHVMNMIYFISIVTAVSIYSDFHGSIVYIVSFSRRFGYHRKKGTWFYAITL